MYTHIGTLYTEGEDRFLEVDLGYTVLYILPAQANKASVKLLLACCPCCYSGLRRALLTLWHRRLFHTFIFGVSVGELLSLCAEVVVNRGAEAPEDNPLLGPSLCTLMRMQARLTCAIVNHGQVWRLIVPIFLHGGVLHLVLNVWSQLAVGIMSEYKWGSGCIATVYLLTGLSGNILSSITMPGALGVGASGAIMGLTGFSAANAWVTWAHAEPYQRNLQLGGVAVALGLLVVIGAVLPDRIDNWTHGGGFVSGLLAGFCAFRKYCVHEWHKTACLAAGTLLALGLVTLLVLLFTLRVDDIAIPDCPLFP